MNTFGNIRRSISAVLLAALPVFHGFPAAAQDMVRDTTVLDRDLCGSPAGFLGGRMSGVRSTISNGDLAEGVGMLVRGLNSVRTDSSPLWVVDGMPLGNLQGTASDRLLFLNVHDIESIEVLKDISSTAMYGPLGGNGVIIVNTRRQGTGDGWRAEWNSNVGLSMPYVRTGAARTSVSHNHSVSVSYSKGKSMLYLSGEYVDRNAAVARNFARTGNFSAMYETMVNPVIWFGTRTMYSVGNTSSPASTEQFMSPSLMVSARYPDDPSLGTVDGWKEGYDNDARKWRLVNSSYLTVNILKELNVKAEFGIDYQDITRYVWYGDGTPQGDLANGSASIGGFSMLRFNIKPSINWNRWFGRHSVRLSAGAMLIMDDSRRNIMEGSDFFSQELRAKGLNIHSSRTSLNNCSIGYRTYNAYLSGSYAFADRAGLDFCVMPGWTPKYDDSVPQMRYGVSAWVNVINGLKITGGYGVSGNEAPVPYVSFDDYLSSFPTVDPDLSFWYEGLWRTTSQEWNVGLGFDFMKGRLQGSAKYFRKHTDDAFHAYCFGEKGQDYLWDWSDRTDYFSQVTSFTSSGVEVDVDAVVLKGRNIRWSIGASFTWNDNVVTSVEGSDGFGQDIGDGIVSNACVVGRTPCSIVGYLSDEQGNVIDRTGEGEITVADMAVLGNPLPKYYGGLETTFDVAGFSFQAVFDWAAGYDLVDMNRCLADPDPVTRLKSLYVGNGSYFRMGTLAASYDFRFKRKPVLESLRITLAGHNLFTASPYDGWNPAADCYGSRGAHGLDYGTYPSQRSVVLGIKLLFR